MGVILRFEHHTKVPENPIARDPVEVGSNITFRDPIVAW
jgi:hypothetical protein